MPPKFTARLFTGLVQGKAFQNAIKDIPEEIWSLSKAQLEVRISLTPLDRRLRKRLWSILPNGKGSSRTRFSQVYKGLCSYTYIYNYILKNPTKLAWLFSTEVEFEWSTSIAQSMCLDQLKQILNLEVLSHKGEINYGVLRAKVDIFNLLLQKC